MQRICVYGGANRGKSQAHAQAARDLGAWLARQGIRVVFGGGNVGLMSELADAVLAGGGSLTGVIPRFFVARGLRHAGVDDMRVVETMHERKALMAELAEGFIALPGGLGTLEELCEILTWAQIGLHQKPVGLLNVDGFYDPLRQFLDQMVAQQFLRPIHAEILICDESPGRLVDRLRAFRPVTAGKWLHGSLE